MDPVEFNKKKLKSIFFNYFGNNFEEVLNKMDRQETSITNLHDVPNYRDKKDVKLQKRWIQRVPDARREEKLKFQTSKAKDKEKIFPRCIVWLLIIEVVLTSLVLYLLKNWIWTLLNIIDLISFYG